MFITMHESWYFCFILQLKKNVCVAAFVSVAGSNLAVTSPRSLTVQNESGETVQIVATDAQGNIITGGKRFV
jgi:hypothetical protein